MLTATVQGIGQWTEALHPLVFPDVRALVDFLDAVGSSAEKMSFDILREQSILIDGKQSIQAANGLQLTAFGVQLLSETTELNFDAVVEAAHKVGAVPRTAPAASMLQLFFHDHFGSIEDGAVLPLGEQNTPGSSVSFAPAPRSFEDLVRDELLSPEELFQTRFGIDGAASVGDIANVELGRRQLHLRALTQAMHRAGFPDYDANEAFYLACLCANQVTLSEPIVTSSSCVSKLLSPSERNTPVTSSNTKDTYTYVNDNLFGFRLSFGFASICYPGGNDGRLHSVAFPLLGLDDAVIKELAALETDPQRSRASELTRRVLKYTWNISTISSHDHVHGIVNDLSPQFPESPTGRGGLHEKIYSIRAKYLGLTNEMNATIVQGGTFLMIEESNPEVRKAIFRQTIAFVDDIADLREVGLSKEAAAYLLFIGFSHVRGILPLDEVGPGTDSDSIITQVEARFENKDGARFINELLSKRAEQPIAFNLLPSGLAPTGPIAPLNATKFPPSVTDYTESHINHNFGLLNELLTAVKQFVLDNRGAYPELDSADARREFQSETLPQSRK
jgi:hypothetical protein